MIVFDSILVMLAFAVLLLALARRFKLPYPVLLALAGAAVAVVQVDVGLHLNPELALALFIAPVLLDAAYDTSLRDLKRHSFTTRAQPEARGAVQSWTHDRLR
jgi:NhaP-type Na+/H+ or K+/H+ antiporter